MTKPPSGNSNLSKIIVIDELGHTSKPDVTVFSKQKKHFSKSDPSKASEPVLNGADSSEPLIGLDAFKAEIQYYLIHGFKVSRRAPARKALKDLSKQNSNHTKGFQMQGSIFKQETTDD